jgi:hypothetical protein
MTNATMHHTVTTTAFYTTTATETETLTATATATATIDARDLIISYRCGPSRLKIAEYAAKRELYEIQRAQKKAMPTADQSFFDAVGRDVEWVTHEFSYIDELQDKQRAEHGDLPKEGDDEAEE